MKIKRNIRSILIANRAEIASRIIKTCKKMGIRTLVVFSETDQQLPFVYQADIAVPLNGKTATESYLDQDKIIQIALKFNVDAIHPGYGFLSEQAVFAQKCADNALVFIGPSPLIIEQMGIKSTAKSIAQKQGVPVIPGYSGKDQNKEFLVQKANEIGFPILIKAVAGGGGKGMRIAHNSQEVELGIDAAKREAMNAFGNDELMIEKYFEKARHIEVQVFGDSLGNHVHLYERECSIQRRYQKVIEESPSAVLDESTRSSICQAALNLSSSINYVGAGTVEFVYTDEGFYFLEMNTRLQVEHPVTELITGLDLVEWQILVASGAELPLTQADIQAHGYAIECRLYAEDPMNSFFPVSGNIALLEAQEVDGSRYELGYQSGNEVSIYFDPMIAKLLVHSSDRVSGIQKMQYAVEKLKCIGIQTNQRFLRTLLKQDDFIAAKYYTKYLDECFDAHEMDHTTQDIHFFMIAATLYQWYQNLQNKTHSISPNWRNSKYAPQSQFFLIGDEVHESWYDYETDNEQFVFNFGAHTYSCSIHNCTMNKIMVHFQDCLLSFDIVRNNKNCYIHSDLLGQFNLIFLSRFPEIEKAESESNYKMAMPGEILELFVNAGQHVQKGMPLAVVVSMKMESTIYAQKDCTIADVLVQKGQAVDAGTLLFNLKEA